ncbi:PilZ domain-containing protein [Bradyrhizobium sp. ISRA443]|uniref:PilZ domain-containing protein n=1 Tax=unclassified Bradyrhizobium TaxID=2631580 RepID=UPI00247A3129|nr:MULTISPECIES: PilZ domain-containing protein [unclassified Bradyrhizobium]WGS00332.1 PilZ domain-containing protein [Bradyrhizobium sp. ISRA436]WGS07221.1 PilZ domain-containing protein [Bradyrhizobium sp. ISRA437]WGS14106.1 PilZ domain-containing protein [Bradyrhizobium sp. ISRA443]
MASNGARVKVSREPRRQLNKRAAWITVDDGATESECAVVDVSPGGAKIVSEVVFDVKDRLALTLLADHSKRYACEVVWRRGKTYGLKFVVAEPADEALAEPAGAAGTKS